MSGTACGVIALIMWAFTSVVLALLSGISTFEIVGAAFFLCFIGMTGSQIVNKEPIASYWRRPLSEYLFWLLGPGLYTVLLYMAFKMAPPFEVNILNYLWPILLVIFASFMHDVTLNLTRAAGIIAGFSGLFIVTIPPASDNFFDDFNWGHGLALICAVLWSSYSALRKKPNYPMGFLAPLCFVFSMICFLLDMTFETTVIPNGFQIFLILVLGITRLSYALWDTAMKSGDIMLLTSLSYFLPLITTLLLVVFGFGTERPLVALGAVLIIGGCLLVNADKISYFFKKKFNPIP
ncbi:MAG: DMT family transporter [Alphaproteobacteria bacterium]